MKPVTLLYSPRVVPVTVTLKLQLAPAASDPPVSAMVRVAAVVIKVPPHCAEDESATDKPAGNTSVNAMPVNAWFPGAVLLIVNANVELEPCAIEAGEKDLLSVG